jgi:hypothetical protein
VARVALSHVQQKRRKNLFMDYAAAALKGSSRNEVSQPFTGV